jgi:hypothetical protein
MDTQRTRFLTASGLTIVGAGVLGLVTADPR